MHRNFVILQKKTTPSDRKQNSTPSDCEQNSTLSDKDQHLVDVTFPEDVGLPYMTDGRHPPDTLFLVAEHDFRFYREHCVSTKDWLSEVDDFVSEYLEGPDMEDSWGILQPADAPDTDPAPLLQKKLLQAPLSTISFGRSTTGCFAYDVWLHRKLLVVASNLWLAELAMLRKADHDWLVVNSVVIDVQEPLWQG